MKTFGELKVKDEVSLVNEEGYCIYSVTEVENTLEYIRLTLETKNALNGLNNKEYWSLDTTYAGDSFYRDEPSGIIIFPINIFKYKMK